MGVTVAVVLIGLAETGPASSQVRPGAVAPLPRGLVS